MTKRIFIDGVGNAGTAVLHALADQRWPATRRPKIELRDRGRWGRRHVEAALVDRAELGRPKVVAAARRLRDAGWTDESLTTVHGDIRDLPRAASRGGLTIAATDSHATKHLSVVRSQQVGSPAIAVGLGSGDATVELFLPGGAGYCCVHGADTTWQRRQPCLAVSSVSTTEIAWRGSRDTVRIAGELVARMIAYYTTVGRLPHHGGYHVSGTTAALYTFPRDHDCPGPHDPPCMVESPQVVRIPTRAAQLAVGVMLDRVGANGCYSDREVTWQWDCHRCGQGVRRVHVVHPPLKCAACGQPMQSPLERASGLTAAELADLNGGRSPTLADVGLGDETIVRCTTGCGRVVWIELEAVEDGYHGASG